MSIASTTISNWDQLLETARQNTPARRVKRPGQVESREDIIPRPSHLNLGVRLSPHPASDVLSFRFCSCEYNRGNFRE